MAATRAGYRTKTAQEQSSRLLANVSVAEAIAKAQLLKKTSGAEVVIEQVGRAQNLKKLEIQKSVSEAIKLVRSVVRTETVGSKCVPTRFAR